MAKLLFHPAAERDFEALPRIAKEKVKNCLRELAANPLAGKPLHGPLRGFFVYRFNAGGVSYRIAYEVVKHNVIILMIGTRDNFYKIFSHRTR
jgi:mRNA-degrading endonuclease RelE of RelBE toxin-antitoxin system